MLLTRYDDTVSVETWGETAIFINPGRVLPKGVYFATLKDHDGANDRASGLDRPAVFRLSFGVPCSEYVARFGPRPPRPGKGGVVEGDWDFKDFEKLQPHPVYGWMGWVAILNPSRSSLDRLVPLLDASHLKARRSLSKRLQASGSREASTGQFARSDAQFRT